MRRGGNEHNVDNLQLSKLAVNENTEPRVDKFDFHWWALHLIVVSCPCLSQFTYSASLSQHLGSISYSVDKVGTLRESKTVAWGFVKPISPSHQSRVTDWG